MTITQQQIERLTLLMKRSEIDGEYSLRRGDVHLSNQKKRIADDLRAAIETLEKLPVTADGVCVVPGMVLYYTSPAGVIETTELELWDDVIDHMNCPNPMFSTREAAEAARKENR